MDKRLILSVAGSGKTTYVLNKLCLEKRHLLITFTNNNFENLRLGIIRKFGYLPENIKIFTYFSFLYNFAYKPFCSSKVRAKGITWTQPRIRFPKSSMKHYITPSGYLYGSRIAKLLIECNLGDNINQRISKYFDCLYIDEVQDFAGSDFNLLKIIIHAEMNIILVGDFFQHTFDTSHDGNINNSLYDNLNTYISKFTEQQFPVDNTTLSKSYRCSPAICQHISEQLQIPIESHKETAGDIKFISTRGEAESIFHDDSIVKLFYREHYKYPCFSENWGASKGNDHYINVCVVLSKNNYQLLLQGDAHTLLPTTRNKLYVAISRGKERLYFVQESMISHFKRQ